MRPGDSPCTGVGADRSPSYWAEADIAATRLGGSEEAAVGIATADSRRDHARGEEGRRLAGTREISARARIASNGSMGTYRIAAGRMLLVRASGPLQRRIWVWPGVTRIPSRIVSLTIGVVVVGMTGHLYVLGRSGDRGRGKEDESRIQGCEAEL